MQYSNHPIEFEDNELRDKWVNEFRPQMVAICSKYKVTLSETVHLVVTDKQVGITALGSYMSGSAKEHALNEILSAYERVWNE